MNLLPRVYPTFARELLAARATLTLAREVGLAVRAHRRVLGLGQRTYARHRGWSASHVARLEARAGELKLSDVLAALAPTDYCLALCRRPGTADPDPRAPAGAAALPVPVAPTHWPRTELVALVRDGSRRFPAHHTVEQVDFPPTWWWYAESTRAGSRAPHWYARPPEDAPRPPEDAPRPPDDAGGAIRGAA